MIFLELEAKNINRNDKAPKAKGPDKHDWLNNIVYFIIVLTFFFGTQARVHKQCIALLS